MSFDRLVNAATERNRAFFDSLACLPASASSGNVRLIDDGTQAPAVRGSAANELKLLGGHVLARGVENVGRRGNTGEVDPALDWLVDAVESGSVELADTMPRDGDVCPPTVHMLCKHLAQPYLGSVATRPFRRGPDSASAVAALGLLGDSYSYRRSQSFFNDGPRYSEDRYQRAALATYAELTATPGKVASQLVAPLLRAFGTAQVYSAALS